MAASLDRDLETQIAALRQTHGDSVRIDDVAAVVRSLLGGQSAAPSGDTKLFREVKALYDYIDRAKAELAQLRPDDIQTRYIASATDELDAIVGATENATNTILDTAERLQDLAAELPPDPAQRLTDATTMIFEACNFQDITGQRITKVVRALKHIEERIAALVSAFGPELALAPAPAVTAGPGGKPTDEELLNGPQLADKAHDQAAIDALFNNG